MTHLFDDVLTGQSQLLLALEPGYPPPLAYAATELADPYSADGEPEWDNSWIDIGGEG